MLPDGLWAEGGHDCLCVQRARCRRAGYRVCAVLTISSALLSPAAVRLHDDPPRPPGTEAIGADTEASIMSSPHPSAASPGYCVEPVPTRVRGARRACGHDR